MKLPGLMIGASNHLVSDLTSKRKNSIFATRLQLKLNNYTKGADLGAFDLKFQYFLISD